MDLLQAWLVFPLVLVLLCGGAGFLVCRLSRLPPDACALLPLGFAAIVVVSSLAAWIPGTAMLAAPAVVGLAAGGCILWLASGSRPGRQTVWPAGAACAVFLVFGAPILLSGQATFAGYISLDDASTLFAMTDRALEHGRSIDGLPPSTYEATLATSLTTGYPLGTLLPIGIGAKLTGQDVAWVFQPYLAFLAALLALGLYGLSRHATDRPAQRAALAFVAAQPALLYGFGLWDGVKELAAAALLVGFAPLAVRCASPRGPWVAAGLTAAGLLLALSLGAAIWLVPAVLVAVGLATIRRVWRPLAAAAATAVVCALPALGAASTWLTGSHVSSWRDEGRLANLVEPLSPLQAAGIWPAGDFRFQPDDPGPTYVLIALVFALGLIGLAVWVRRRAWEPIALAGSAVVGAVAIWTFGSPWVAAKAFATVSPVVLIAAAFGCVLLWRQRRTVEAGVAAAAVAGGVLWSNALAFHDVSLAPRGQLAELETIGSRFAREGPALMTEYQPYGVRHFLRALDPEGASELRRRPVRLRDGTTLRKGGYASIDAFRLDTVLVYRTLVLRVSPFESRPPSVYRRVWHGRWYEVWQRPSVDGAIVDRLPLGSPVGPAAVADCDAVLRVAARADRLAAVIRDDSVLRFPVPSGDEVVSLPIRRAGWRSIWIAGSTNEPTVVVIDGRDVARTGPHLNNGGQVVRLATARLAAGRHTLSLRRERPWWRPGLGATEYGSPALVVSAADPPQRVVTLPSAEAPKLCGRSLDWLEALG